MRDPRIETAMILAAGHGRRLRPLTDHLPKPLVPVLGRPLLAIVADRLRGVGVRRLVVNAHHLADQVVAAAAVLDGFDRVDVSREEELLGTGGGIARARPLFGGAPRILLHNGDVWTDAPLDGLLRHHAATGAAATLLLVSHPATDSVLLAPDGTVRAVAGHPDVAPGDGDRLLTYAGVAVLEERFLALLDDTPSSLVPALRRAVTDPFLGVAGWAPDGVAWDDLGSVDAYLDLHARLLAASGRPRRLAPDARVADDAELAGWYWIGPGASVGAGARLEDAVVLPGGVVPPGVDWRRRVVGRGWVATAVPPAARELLVGSGMPGPHRLEPLAAQGSDRPFWRVRDGDGRTAVLLAAEPGDAELRRLLACTRFLHRHELGGPALLAADPAGGVVLLEDLGDTSLEAACRSTPERVEEIYGRVLDLLVAWQTQGTAALGELAAQPDLPPPPLDFTAADLAWEHDYFRRRFLEETAGVPPARQGAVLAELAAVAERVAAQPRVLMHRDFQSRNIHLVDGTPRTVDVQGLRRGPLGYDPASLLFDPYHAPSSPLRERLRECYRRRLAAAGGPDLSATEMAAVLAAAAIQRLAQALGAYGYLSGVKGKASFAAAIPPALARLGEALAEWRRLALPPGPLAALEELVAELRECRWW